MWKTRWIKWKTLLHNAVSKPNYVNKIHVYYNEYSLIFGIKTQVAFCQNIQ